MKQIKSTLRIGFLFLCMFTFSYVANAENQIVTIFPHSTDGSMQTAPYPGSWNIQHSSTYGIHTTTSDERAALYTATYNSNQGYLGIQRGFLAFDTSIIPADAVIETVFLKIFVYPGFNVDEVNDQYSYLNVLESRQASATRLTFDDIELCGNTLINPTKGSIDLDITSIEEDQFLTFPLNEIGRSWINRSGYTKLCIREGHDIENVEVINNSNYWKESGISYYTSEYEGTERDPYLEITYSLPDENEEKTVLELIQDLIDDVKGETFKTPQKHSYLANIEKLPSMLGRADVNAVIAQLVAFIHKLEVDFQKGLLTAGLAENLKSQAEEILDLLAGGI